MRKIPYASAIGSLIYSMIATRPDLPYAIGATIHYISNPRKMHWEPIKLIFGYFPGTTYMQLTFGSGHLAQVEGFTDSDYAGNPNNRKSTSVYVFTLVCGAISGRSKIQECTILSTTKAECIVASEVVKEAIWQQRLSAESSELLPPCIVTDRAQYTSCGSCKDKAHRGKVPSHSGARH